MTDLPRPARIYLLIIYALAAAALFLNVTAPVMAVKPVAPWWNLAIFLAFAAYAGSVKVPLLGIRKNEEATSMSLGFSTIFATLLLLGPRAALVVGIGSTVASCLRPRQAWYQALFNVSITILETTLAGGVFVILNHGLTLNWNTSPLALVAAVLIDFFVNTWSVAKIVAICDGELVVTLWQETFLMMAPSFFIGAGVATAMVALFRNALATVIVVALPIGYLTWASYRRYADNADALLAGKERLANLYLATIRSLALAIDAKDQYTHQHILRVQQYAVATAKQMGVDGDELVAIETGALLHDIGKLGVPEYVLLKPGRLTPEEFAKIKEHPRIGADILDPVEFPWPVLPVVKYHHERMDGTGYPEGLKGEEIPLTARILAVADVYDALTSNRSYRNAWSHERALDEVQRLAGPHFDPQVVEAFTVIIDGVLDTMAAEGIGPRAPRPATTGAGAEGEQKLPRAAVAARDIQRASSELWALYEVAQTLSAGIGLQDTLNILAGKLDAIFPGTACVFLLAPPETLEGGNLTALTARAAVGVNAALFRECRTHSEKSRSLLVAREQETYLGDYDHDDLLTTTNESAPWTELASALIVPIVHQGQVLGTINLYHPETDAFSAHDQFLLEIIAERTALALFNGLLFDRTRSQSITDPLTGLANVRHLTATITERLERGMSDGAGAGGERDAYDERFALLCLDLDTFKPINDNFGHQRGDEVLQDLASILRSGVRPGDVVARYGGDEFVVLLQGADYALAAEIALRLQNCVAEYNPGLHHPRLGDLRLGVSVGIACFPEDGTDPARLFAAADRAMYRDKTERKLGHLVGGGEVTAPSALLHLSGGLRPARLTPPPSTVAAGNGGAELRRRTTDTSSAARESEVGEAVSSGV